MQRYILGRLFQALLVLLVISAIVFFMSRLTGNPVDLMLDEYATAEDRKALSRYLGLDKPLYQQYAIFLVNAAQGDFGKSIRAQRSAMALTWERFPATLELAGAGILISIVLAVPIGVYSAVRRGSALDLIGRISAVLGQSMPQFWLGLILILIFAVWLGVLPSGGRGDIRYLILPAITAGWYIVAGMMRLMRSSMLDVMDSDYIKLARLKGLPESVVIWKHGLKNATLPVITFAAILFVGLLNGAIVTEMVFAWPGIGRLAVDAVRWRDFPVVQAVTLLSSAMFVFANLFVDIAYGYLNPKIRYQK